MAIRSRLRHPLGAAAVMVVLTVPAVLVARPASAASTTTTFSYTGAPVAIPENPGAPAIATLNVAGLSGVIADVDLRIDGDPCTANSGDPNAGITHTFVSDLQIKLISPAGTSVLAADRVDGGGNNLCQTRLDDEAATPIGSVVAAQAPFTGSFKPSAPLSALDMENPNGTWKLSVQDLADQDTGQINKFSIIVTTARRAEVSPNADGSGGRDRPHGNRCSGPVGHRASNDQAPC